MILLTPYHSDMICPPLCPAAYHQACSRALIKYISELRGSLALTCSGGRDNSLSLSPVRAQICKHKTSPTQPFWHWLDRSRRNCRAHKLSSLENAPQIPHGDDLCRCFERIHVTFILQDMTTAWGNRLCLPAGGIHFLRSPSCKIFFTFQCFVGIRPVPSSSKYADIDSTF